MANTKKPAQKGGARKAAPVMPDLSGRGDLPRTLSADEQWERSLVDAKEQGRVWAQLAASAMSAVDLPASVATPKKPSLWRRFRSAVTGRWVSRLFAKQNPDTTVSERVK